MLENRINENNTILVLGIGAALVFRQIIAAGVGFVTLAVLIGVKDAVTDAKYAYKLGKLAANFLSVRKAAYDGLKATLKDIHKRATAAGCKLYQPRNGDAYYAKKSSG